LDLDDNDQDQLILAKNSCPKLHLNHKSENDEVKSFEEIVKIDSDVGESGFIEIWDTMNINMEYTRKNV